MITTTKHRPALIVTATLLAIMVITGVFQEANPATGQEPSDYTQYFPLVMTPLPPQGWIGPGGGTITTVVIDPKNINTIYAASFGAGVFKSTDGGVTWNSSSQGMWNPYVQSIAVDPVNPNVLYAGGYKEGMYKSTNAGASWFFSNTGIQPEATIYTITVDRTNNNRVLIATRGISNNNAPPWKGVIYITENAGASWQAALENVGTTQDWAYSLAYHPFYPNWVYAAFHENGPYLNSQFGKLGYWARMDWETVSNKSGRVIAIRPRYEYNATMFFGVWHTETNNGVYRTQSRDGGWNLQTLGLAPAHIKSLAFNPVTPTTVYIGTFGSGFKVSTDDGFHWTTRSLGDVDGIYSIAPVPASSSNIFVGTSLSGVLQSTNGGYNWVYSHKGLNASQITGLVVNPTTSTLLSSTFGSGAFKSTDQGGSWTPITGGTGERFFNGLAIDPSNPSRIFALTSKQGLWIYNGDSGWTSIQLPEVAYAVSEEAISMPPFNPLEMLDEVDREGFTTETGQIGLSAVDQAYAPLWDMEFALSNTAIAYLGTDTGVLKSTSGGANWISVMRDTKVTALAVHPTNPDSVVASTGACNVYFTTNGGTNWTPQSPANCASLYALDYAGEPKILYAATGIGLLRYVSGSWVNTTLTSPTLSITSDPQNPQHLFAGTTSGARISVDGGNTWAAGPAEISGLTVADITIENRGSYLSVYFQTTTRGTFLKIYPLQEK